MKQRAAVLILEHTGSDPAPINLSGKTPIDFGGVRVKPTKFRGKHNTKCLLSEVAE